MFSLLEELNKRIAQQFSDWDFTESEQEVFAAVPKAKPEKLRHYEHSENCATTDLNFISKSSCYRTAFIRRLVY